MAGVLSLFMDPEIESGAAPLVTTPTLTPSATAVNPLVKEAKTRKRRKSLKKSYVEDVALKKQRITPTDPAPSISTLSSTYGQLAEKHGNVDDLKEWKARNETERRDAVKRATLELFLHNLTQEDELNVHQARLQELERERDAASKECKDAKKKIKKLEEDKATAAAYIQDLINEKSNLEKSIEAKDATLTASNDTISKLTKENEDLKADQANGWAEEKKQVKGAAFQDGFHNYLKTFMAAAPDFDWTSHFGGSMGKWMAEFAVTESSAIGEKKIQLQAQLEKERARPLASTQVETEPNDKDVDDEVEDMA